MTATSTATNNNPLKKIHTLLLGSRVWTLVIVATAAVLYTGIFSENPVTAVIGLALFAVIVIAAYVTAAKRASE